MARLVGKAGHLTEKLEIRRPFKNGEMHETEKNQAAQSRTYRSGLAFSANAANRRFGAASGRSKMV